MLTIEPPPRARSVGIAGLHPEQRAGGVHGERAVPGRKRVVGDQRLVDDPGVVDEDVEGAVECRDGGRPVVGRRHVEAAVGEVETRRRHLTCSCWAAYYWQPDGCIS